MKIEFLSLITLAFGTAGASTIGVSKPWRTNVPETAKKSCREREYGSFYSKLGMSFDVRRYDMFHLDFEGPSEYNVLQTSLAGLSFLPSIGWDRLLRFEGSLRSGSGPENGPLSTIHRVAYLDGDLKCVLFVPMVKKVQMGLSFGAEYKYHHDSALLSTGEFQTDSMTYLRGVTAGLRIETQPSMRWNMRMGVEYHMPSVKVKIRTEYNEPLVERWLHGGRHGLTSFIGMDYQMTKSWAFNMAFEATDLQVKGAKQAASSGYETGIDTFKFQYTQYSFGFNYRF